MKRCAVPLPSSSGGLGEPVLTLIVGQGHLGKIVIDSQQVDPQKIS